MAAFRSVVPGIEDLPANFNLPRHRHFHAYATLVLKGGFEQAGYAGRVKAVAGDLLIHPVLDCHVNRMLTPGLRLLRLPWHNGEIAGGFYRPDQMDLIVRTASRDVREAQLLVSELIAGGKTRFRGAEDWPDLLAQDIQEDKNIRIVDWAELKGLRRETISRGFGSAYGVAAASFRSEWRARNAWLELSRNKESLSQIAARTGFADQAHMTRSVSRIAGAPPSRWR